MSTGKKERFVGPPNVIGQVKPKISIRSRMRRIGNSKGVILSSRVIEAAGLNADDEIVIEAVDGVIYILPLAKTGVNTDLSTWDKQFKQAIKNGAKPEGDMFKGLVNEFDLKEW